MTHADSITYRYINMQRYSNVKKQIQLLTHELRMQIQIFTNTVRQIPLLNYYIRIKIQIFTATDTLTFTDTTTYRYR